MRRQRAWPVRYKVTAWRDPDDRVEYKVLTWYGEEKAVALAVEEYVRQHGEVPVDLVVTDLGDAPKDERGLVSVGSDLHDRGEF